MIAFTDRDREVKVRGKKIAMTTSSDRVRTKSYHELLKLVLNVPRNPESSVTLQNDPYNQF